MHLRKSLGFDKEMKANLCVVPARGPATGDRSALWYPQAAALSHFPLYLWHWRPIICCSAICLPVMYLQPPVGCHKLRVGRGASTPLGRHWAAPPPARGRCCRVKEQIVSLSRSLIAPPTAKGMRGPATSREDEDRLSPRIQVSPKLGVPGTSSAGQSLGQTDLQASDIQPE